jgi:peptide chain release factor 2
MLTSEEFLKLKQDGIEYLNLLKIEEILTEKEKLEQEFTKNDIWNQPELANQLSKKLARLNQKIEIKNKFEELVENLEISLEIKDEISSLGIEKKLKSFLSNLEQQALFTSEFDDEDCFLSIQSGAGGVDAQDWAAMLLSMYQTFSKNQGLDYSTVSLSLNSEGGVKNCMLEITGNQAFGLFKEEAGVHRLIRISPFNSGGTRETSFALVEVLPASVENSQIEVEINEKDIRWEVSTSQGAGGQSVNTTYSAVKLIHEPTGITVSCQNERSQIQNRAQALKVLKSRLLSLEIQKRQDLKSDLKGDFKSPEWGSQIRSYTLHPYKLVKDHRSGWETTNPNQILEDGELLPVIFSVKKSRLQK